VKSLFKSKTFWFNLLTFGTTMVDVLPPNIQSKMLPILAFGNIALRTITTQSVSILPKKED